MREFGSEFEIEYAKDYYFDNICQLKEHYAFTRSGREAIGLAAMAIEKGVVLMPAYCCWSMELPFEQAGFVVEYYKLNEDLSVDLNYLGEQIKKHTPKAVLVMNYFGFVSTAKTVYFIKKADENIKVIEDFTQSLFCLKENFNSKVDAYVASIRKSVGVPDGGIIVTSLPIDYSVLKEGVNTPFVSEHIAAGREKMRYRYTGSADDKVTFRKKHGVAGQDIINNYGLYHISEEALSIVEHTIVDTVRVARYNNYMNLYEAIKDIKFINILFAPSKCNQAPFTMVIYTEKRNELQTKLAKVGVYAQVLWPLKDRAKQICSVSKYMEEHMLAIPIDQRYFYDDIMEMSERIKSVVN